MLNTLLNGRYQILKSLGRGGFGETFLVEDYHLPNYPQCVIKLLDPQSKDPQVLKDADNRFKQEIETLGKLNDLQIPRLLDNFEENEKLYLVQEYIDGHSLSQELPPKTPCWSEDQVISMLLDVLKILEVVHKHKIIHRDIKPDNIIRRRSDQKLVLIDFGAAKQITPTSPISLNQRYTITIGTLGYMPLEQQSGSPVFKSDVYAVGIIAIVALTGKDPHDLFYDAQTNSIQWHHLAPSDPSPGLKRVIDKMIHLETKSRYATTEALKQLEELKRNIQPGPTVIIDNDTHKQKLSFPLLKIILGLIVILSLFMFYIKIKSHQFILEYQKATILYQQKDYKNALIYYDKVIQQSPDNYEAWLGKANSLMALAKYSQAIKTYDQAINLNNNSWEAWLNKGNIYLQIKSPKEALESYQKTVTINSNSSIAWKDIAYISSDQGNSKQAAEAFKQFLNRESGSFSDWYFYGKVLSNIQEYDTALEAYDNAIKKAKKTADYVQVWWDKALIFSELKRYQDAVKALDEVIAIQPDNYRAWYRKGKALEKITGQEEAAATAYLKSSQIKPSYIFSSRNLGRLRLMQKNYIEAKINFERVLEYSPNNQEALEQLDYIRQEITKIVN